MNSKGLIDECRKEFEEWWKESLFTECYHTAQEAFAEGWGASLRFNNRTTKPVLSVWTAC